MRHAEQASFGVRKVERRLQGAEFTPVRAVAFAAPVAVGAAGLLRDRFDRLLTPVVEQGHHRISDPLRISGVRCMKGTVQIERAGYWVARRVSGTSWAE
jgi:hypothetical protein